jgi:Planctomycete cytochrome C
MSSMQRPRALARLLFAAAWFVSVPEPLSPFHTHAAAQDPFGGVEESIQEQDAGAMNQDESTAPARRGATKKARRPRPSAPAEKGTRKKPTTDAAKEKDQAKKPAAAEGPSFAKDVAPILVANCIGCHREGQPGLNRGKLDLTTFEKLMKGTTANEKVVQPGKPSDSHMILRIKGEEEPRMPQGGNNNGLAADVISRFENWVKAGATLDAGLDPKAPIESYAASLDDFERSKLAKLSPKDREAKIQSVGLERWKKANPNLKPEITPGEHFVLFSNLPKDRAVSTVKALDAQHGNLRRLIGPGATDWVEKVSLYVFDDRKDYVEFVRTIQQGEVDPEESGRGDLRIAEPYVVVPDPHDSGKTEPAAKRKTGGRRRGERDSEGGSHRSLVGLLGEHTAEAAVSADGKSPRWLAAGVGAYVGSQIDRRADHFRKLRETALEKYQQGWPTKTNEVLGDGAGVSPDEFRAISFALVECLTSPRYRELFPDLITGLRKGGDKLDDVLKDVYGATREEFFNDTGVWVAESYGNNQ